MIVNINRMNNLNDSLDSSIKNYESYIYDVLSIAKRLSFYWNDGYTESFFRYIDVQQQFINEAVDSLYSFSNTLRVATSYFNDINANKDDIGTPGLVNSDDFVVIDGDDDERKIRKENLRYRTWHAEDDIAIIISRIVTPSVSVISFNDLNRGSSNEDFVGMRDDIVNEIGKLKSKISHSLSYIDGVRNKLLSVGKVYHSENVHNFNDKAEEILRILDVISNNFDSACSYVEHRRTEYIHLFEDLSNDIKDIN